MAGFISVLAVPSSTKWGEPHAREDPPAPVASIASDAAPHRFLALLPCDPDTVAPGYLPPEPRSRGKSADGKPLKRIDLRTTTTAALRAAAAASGPQRQPKAPCPPVPAHRLGLPTGAAPKRRRVYGKGGGAAAAAATAADREASPGARGGSAGGSRLRPGGGSGANLATGGRAPDADARLAEFLAGRATEPPWDSLGVAKPPVIGGALLDLRLLWNLVSSQGGYEETLASKKWARVAQDMGHDCRVITNAGWLVRHHYLRFLMPYEAELRRAGRFPGPAAVGGMGPVVLAGGGGGGGDGAPAVEAGGDSDAPSGGE